MFPHHILHPLTPNAAKLYLTLISFVDLSRRAPIAHASIDTLSRVTALSPRTCSRAIRQLKDLQIIKVPPHRYHAPASYLFLPMPAAPNPVPASPPPQATMPAKTPSRQPHQSTITQGAAKPNPIPAPKPPCPPPEATLLNTSQKRPTPAPPGVHQTHLPTRAELNHLLAQLAAAAGVSP